MLSSHRYLYGSQETLMYRWGSVAIINRRSIVLRYIRFDRLSSMWCIYLEAVTPVEISTAHIDSFNNESDVWFELDMHSTAS